MPPVLLTTLPVIVLLLLNTTPYLVIVALPRLCADMVPELVRPPATLLVTVKGPLPPEVALKIFPPLSTTMVWRPEFMKHAWALVPLGTVSVVPASVKILQSVATAFSAAKPPSASSAVVTACAVVERVEDALPFALAVSEATTKHWRASFQTVRWILFIAVIGKWDVFCRLEILHCRPMVDGPHEL